ncbi:MAG: acetoacetate decarboxylase family protein [Pseudomonadales bacterium]
MGFIKGLKLLYKILGPEPKGTTNGFVKSYKEIMGAVKPTAEFTNAEMLTLVWETTPEAIAQLLPPPLKPTDKPMVIAFIAHYPTTNFSLPYNESALLVRASYNGVVGNYCLSMPVTNDMAMAGGREQWGYPKKMANISFERNGDTVEGFTERHGIKFMKVKAKLSGKVNNDNAAMDELLAFGINPKGQFSEMAFNFKHFPSPDPDEAFDYPPRLVTGETVFRPKTFIFSEAEIELTPSEFDPWHQVPVKRMLGGFYTVGDNTMMNGKVLAEVGSIEFAPYSFLKWEFGQHKS